MRRHCMAWDCFFVLQHSNAMFNATRPVTGCEEPTTATNSHAATLQAQNTKMDAPTLIVKPALGKVIGQHRPDHQRRRRKQPAGRANRQGKHPHCLRQRAAIEERTDEHGHHHQEHREDTGRRPSRDTAMKSKQTMSKPTVHVGHSMQHQLGHVRQRHQEAFARHFKPAIP